MHSGKEPFHLPSSAVATQQPPALSFALSLAAVGHEHLDAVFGGELLVKRVRVVGLVADEPCGEFVDKACGRNVLHKLALGRRSAFDRYGERKTVTNGDSNDLGALAATTWAGNKAPFLALANPASTKVSSRFILPCSCRRPTNRFRASSSLPERSHCWKRRWQVWNGGYLSGSSRHCAPVPSTQSTPFNAARVSCHGRPRLSACRAPRNIGSTINHCSSLNSERPAIG
jgi:hypothetical protein